MQIGDRIEELRRVLEKELVAHPKNWRVHLKVQATAASLRLRPERVQ